MNPLFLGIMAGVVALILTICFVHAYLGAKIGRRKATMLVKTIVGLMLAMIIGVGAVLSW